MNSTDKLEPDAARDWIEERRGWHFNKTISITNVLTTITLALAILAWARTIELRVAENTLVDEHTQAHLEKIEARMAQQQIQLERRYASQQQRLDGVRIEIKSDLGSIDTKLDRLIERQGCP